MKFSFLLLSGVFSANVFGGCQAPGQGFLEAKLKEAFVTTPAEKELKDIVTDQRNYALREDIKSLDRRTKYADRIKTQELQSEIHQKFDQMIENTGRTEEIADFPVPGARAAIRGNKEAISIEVKNLSKEDLDVIPPAVLDKLSNKVRIDYRYPYDSYEYYLTYDGRELPMQKAFNKMQSEFEDACDQRIRDNRHAKDLWEQDRKTRGFSPLPGGGSSQ